MIDKNYTEQELIDALWTMRGLFRELAVSLAEHEDIEAFEYWKVLTPAQREMNTQVMDLLARVANPHLEHKDGVR